MKEIKLKISLSDNDLKKFKGYLYGSDTILGSNKIILYLEDQSLNITNKVVLDCNIRKVVVENLEY